MEGTDTEKMDNKRDPVGSVVDGHKFANAGVSTWGMGR